jgi:hypothetical protein
MISPTFAAIVFKTHGKRHNPITRLVSPGDVGSSSSPLCFKAQGAFGFLLGSTAP